LIMRPQLIATYRKAELAHRCQNLFNYLLVPYDGSASAQNLISKIKRQIQENPQSALETCLLCWVIEEGGRTARSHPDQAQLELDNVKADLEGFGTEIKTEVRLGDPLVEILKSGEVNDISAIAICSGKSSGLLKLTVPSFTTAILRAAWHPIIHFPRA
jgi:nucleotide-binding universal stress UspA family protein